MSTGVYPPVQKVESRQISEGRVYHEASEASRHHLSSTTTGGVYTSSGNITSAGYGHSSNPTGSIPYGAGGVYGTGSSVLQASSGGQYAQYSGGQNSMQYTGSAGQYSGPSGQYSASSPVAPGTSVGQYVSGGSSQYAGGGGAYTTTSGPQYAGGATYSSGQYTTTVSGGYGHHISAASGQYEEGRIVRHEIGEPVVTGTRVVGHEVGQERVISVSEHVDESRTHIVSERFIEHAMRVPKKIVREEIIEKVVIIPERVIYEEVIEETMMVREKIIELAKPTVIVKEVEIPEIEYIEKIVEIPEKIVQEKIKNVEKIKYEDRVHQVPKIVQQEKIVQVDEIIHREIPVERIVEIPEIVYETVYVDVPVAQYVDKPVPQYIPVPTYVDVDRHIPIAVEADVAYEFQLPRLRAKYQRITYPIYLPRFVEIPVATELLTNKSLVHQAEAYLSQIGMLTKSAASLCDIETLAANIIKADYQSHVNSIDIQAVAHQVFASAVSTETSQRTETITGTGNVMTSNMMSHMMAATANPAGASAVTTSVVEGTTGHGFAAFQGNSNTTSAISQSPAVVSMASAAAY